MYGELLVNKQNLYKKTLEDRLFLKDVLRIDVERFEGSLRQLQRFYKRFDD
jgi:hypothetical protein